MDALPPSIICQIFSFIPIQHLLTCVNRTCKRFNDIIDSHSILWRHFEFDFPLELNETTTLDSIIERRARLFRCFCIPEAVCEISAPEIDSILSHLSVSKHLVWLDLTGAQISTIHFLKGMQKVIEVLILDSCPNISNCDIQVINKCEKLEQLYIGYTNVSANCIVEVIPSRLHTLECAGILFSVDTLRNLLRIYHRQLQFVTASVLPASNDVLTTLTKEYEDVSLTLIQ